MDPEKIAPQNNTPTEDNSNTQAFEGLHDEGVDIVQGSGASEENEFSTPEVVTPSETLEESSETVSSPLPTPALEPVATVVPVPVEEKPSLSRESANLIASLQEIPRGFVPTPRPKVPPIPSPVKTPAPETPKTFGQAQTTDRPLNDPSIKQIRTFKSDAEEAVKYQNVSKVDIAIAEQKKREKTAIQYEEPSRSHNAGLFIMIVILLLIVLGGGWYYWFSTSQKVEPAPKAAMTVKTIISYSKVAALTVDSDSDALVLIGAKLGQLNAGLGNIYALIPVLSSTSTTPLDITAILKSTLIPSRLLRSLDSNYMIGAYTYDTQNPFIILKDTFFQNAFSGMLEWEKDMRSDLLPVIQVAHENENSVTAAESHFEDVIISNIDARVLRDDQGKTILIYAFADKDTIIITTSEATLKYILDRLLTVRTIQ